ncbi:MAG: putative DNA repair exonuclease rad1 [Lasallia pustulata]|uniref:Putative DNA repair exonuclease rad1 n=1 Tax=Lasallia pustulata TaxID=136370 RepID=A0A5M8Q2P4_9LECA|nr:MAG: putative DNA repair exonuclease rad1 [Lasallia pustulata]
MASANGHEAPLFSAVSSSARQLFQLLRCIGFAQKAQVQITKEGLRFTVEESRVMHGLAFLDKALFTAFNYTPPPPPPPPPHPRPRPPPATFQISLSSLLETLQILGLPDPKDRWPPRSPSHPTPFSTRLLGTPSLCRLSYARPGSPLSITLEEGSLTTTCELATYLPEFPPEIPLARDALAQKIIMRASWLHDAVTELASTSPTRLTMTAAPTAPYFSLAATGPLGSAEVEFGRDRGLLETFQVERRVSNTYKFSMVRAAGRAMACASKVSIRGDEWGVLSLQFMIEVEGGG